MIQQYNNEIKYIPNKILSEKFCKIFSGEPWKKKNLSKKKLSKKNLYCGFFHKIMPKPIFDIFINEVKKNLYIINNNKIILFIINDYFNLNWSLNDNPKSLLYSYNNNFNCHFVRIINIIDTILLKLSNIYIDNNIFNHFYFRKKIHMLYDDNMKYIINSSLANSLGFFKFKIIKNNNYIIFFYGIISVITIIL